jgi:hypothetical protein
MGQFEEKKTSENNTLAGIEFKKKFPLEKNSQYKFFPLAKLNYY